MKNQTIRPSSVVSTLVLAVLIIGFGSCATTPEPTPADSQDTGSDTGTSAVAAEQPGNDTAESAGPAAQAVETMPTNPAEEDAPAHASEPVYWLAEKDGLALAILGSIHVGTAELYPLPAQVMNDFAARGALAVEVDLSRYTEAELQSAAFTYMYFTDGNNLQQLLPPDVLADFTAYVGRFGIPAAAVITMKPWAAESLVSAFVFAELGYDSTQGVETVFFTLAADDSRPILEFEGLDMQFSYMDSFELELQIESLGITLESIDETAQTVSDLISAWKQGDEQRITELIYTDYETVEAVRESIDYLFADRNREWARIVDEDWLADPEVSELCEPGSGPDVFVVVGAGHIVGPHSLIELLAERGFTVARQRF